MTDEEFKRQHREISIRAAQERPPPMPTYSIEYCFNEGTKLRSIPLMGSLEQTIRVTRLGLARRGADFARIIDTKTGAEAELVRRDA
jgi:hypothetical protein